MNTPPAATANAMELDGAKTVGSRTWIIAAVFFLAAAGLGRHIVGFGIAWLISSSILFVTGLRTGQPRTSWLVAGDLLIALALTSQFTATSDWAVPVAGTWSSGAALGWAAAATRFLAAASNSRAGSSLPPTLFTFQGIFVVWWMGESSAAVALALAVALGGACIFLAPQKRAAAAAGAAALVAGVAGADVTGLLAIGIAAEAFRQGERVVSVWLLALLPLTVGSSATVDVAGAWAVAAAVIGALAWPWWTGSLVEHRPSRHAGRLLALAGVVLAFTSSFGTQGFVWLVYAVAGAAAISTRLVSGQRMGPYTPPRHSLPEPAWRGDLVLASAGLLAAWGLILRLAANGLSIGFL